MEERAVFLCESSEPAVNMLAHKVVHASDYWEFPWAWRELISASVSLEPHLFE